MPEYRAPIRDFQFVLNDYLELDSYSNIAGFADAMELASPLLDEGAKLCENVLFPLNQTGDQQGLTFSDGNVITPDGFKEAYAHYVEGGWPSFTCDPAYGGQGLPEFLNMPMVEMMCSSNLSFGMTPGLSHGAVGALYMHGSDALKQTYLPKMVSGEWSGVMCLTEPHCGTDLGLIRTTAEPNDDGSYNLTGTKIFISSGEQDMTENIIHLVLAKLPDAPEGSRGISLFVVPKIMVNEDGSLGERNAVACGSIEHKMGIHASPTCVMNYEGATGWLVGAPHRGLKAMFTMMNEARLYVGMQGLGLAEVAWQNALNYANERLQGRALKGPAFPDKPADPIIVHPDVRRMLLTCKAFCEGARALAMETALKLDVMHRSEDAAEKEEADCWVQLMTPIIKAYFTDMGSEVTNLAMQVHGGHGYIAEYGVEQYVRDARIAQIYEGTNGIQALDLIGRKLPYKYGRYLRAFFHPALEFIEENREVEAMAEFTKPLYQNIKHLQNASLWMAKSGLFNPDDAAGGSVEYLRMFALCVMGYVWARQAKIALEKLGSLHTPTPTLPLKGEGAVHNSLSAGAPSNPLPQGEGGEATGRAGEGVDTAFYEAKLTTARFFMTRQLPECVGLLMKLTAGSKPLMAAKL